MNSSIFRSGSLLFLAIVFTVGLTFATVELPYRIDEILQNTIPTPDADSHVDEISRMKTELFMAHYHVRATGYVGFFLLIGLIVAGFSTWRTGLAALGAFGVMLPVFAQFAGVMFFLAGLGVLNALWLPVLDVSYRLQDSGLVIRAPNDLLRWILGFFGVHSAWPTIIFFTGTGIPIFLFGVYAWLTARARGKGVADFWVYQISTTAGPGNPGRTQLSAAVPPHESAYDVWGGDGGAPHRVSGGKRPGTEGRCGGGGGKPGLGENRPGPLRGPSSRRETPGPRIPPGTPDP
jgi:hypothetical protein